MSDDWCEPCGRFRVSPDDIHLICEGCGDSLVIYKELPDPSYGGNVPTMRTEYSSLGHLKQWIDRTQGVEDANIPIALVHKAKEARCKNLADVISCLKCLKTIEIDGKVVKCSSYYRNATKILRIATGIAPPFMSNDVRGDIETVFEMLERPYRTYQSGKNLPSYQYLLFKICQLLGYEEFLPWFRVFRTMETIRLHDKTWREVCEHNGWNFYDTPIQRD